MVRILYFLIAAVAGSFGVLADFQPARLQNAVVPPLPPHVAGGGEVLLELRVDAEGRVSEVAILRSTPPYTDLVVEAVRAWSFEPARGEEGSRASSVLVAGLFRPPAFYTGTTAGQVPETSSTGSSEIVFPERMTTPPYPPNAYGDGIALVEVDVDRSGVVERAVVKGGTPGFGEAASGAVREWSFRPARIDGEPHAASAIVLVGFRQPVVPGGDY